MHRFGDTEGCCFGGTGNLYYSQEQGESFSYCAAFDLDYSCEGVTASVDYSGCFGLNGWVYIVELAGESYAVSGAYSEGSGTLEIRGDNGTWTCVYADGGGECTSTGGSFDF